MLHEELADQLKNVAGMKDLLAQDRNDIAHLN